MMTPTATGVRAAAEGEGRYTITCLHNANDFDRKALVELVSSKTPEQMHEVLAKPDILVTNAKDKQAMLPVVKKTNTHVRDIFASAQ